MEKGKEKIVIAEDDPRLIELIIRKLKNEGYDVYTATNGKDALATINKIIPDLIILDIRMPEMDGYEVKQHLGTQKLTQNIPVIFLTGNSTLDDKLKGLNLGADDYITKPFKKEELLARIEAILRRKRYYESMAMRDTLTGLYNVMYFNQQFSQFFNMAVRYNQIFSLIFTDVNKFKHINDTYGHRAGDMVLQWIGTMMEKNLRKSDIISRYGGDEFAILLPHTEEDKALDLGKRLADMVSLEKIVIDNETDIQISISVGIVGYSSRYTEKDQMFEVADQRMYENKKKTGNLRDKESHSL